MWLSCACCKRDGQEKAAAHQHRLPDWSPSLLARRHDATAMSAAAPTRQSVLNLFRGLLRTARELEDYNYRSYAKRRVKQGFSQNRALGGEALSKEYKEGLQALALLKRQAVLSHLYPSKKSVMETRK